MPSTRVLRGVVHNALEAYLSRYTSYDGYWLFGFLIERLDHLECDLLAPPEPRGTPAQAAQSRAVQVFHEQIAKAGLGVGCVRQDVLSLRRGRVANVDCEEFSAWGWELHASIRAEAVSGRSFHAKKLCYVAAHNPLVERRSAGAA